MDLKVMASAFGLSEDATEEQILAAWEKHDTGQPKDAPKYIEAYDKTKIRISESEFDALKAKYGQLYILDVVIDPTESYQFIVRRPGRELIEAMADNRDSLSKVNNMIIKNMIVAGDTDALSDGIVYSATIKELGKIVRQGQAFLGKA